MDPNKAYSIIESRITDNSKEVKDALRSVRTLLTGQPLGYKSGAHLVLEDSDTDNFGMVVDKEDKIFWKPGDGSVVGEWSKAPFDNRIHLSIKPPIVALYDKAMSNLEEIVRRRKEEVINRPKTIKHERAHNGHRQSNTLSTLQSLRNKLEDNSD